MIISRERSQDTGATAQAIEWFIELRGDAAVERREAFADWLLRSPVHVEEFLQLAALQGDLTRSVGFKTADVGKLLDEGPSDRNVIPLGSYTVAQDESAAEVGAGLEEVRASKGWRRDGFWSAVAAGILVVVAAVLYPPVRDRMHTERFATAVGEQRSLTLGDGSNVELNVRSELSARIDKRARELRLEDGEALFKVARDPARAFRVYTPQATIEALGTQFNVYVKGDTTTVTLLEGRVSVRREGAEGDAVLLRPGQEIAVGRHQAGAPKARTADLKVATAWTEHRLVFEDTPLSEVIAEFNRYSPQRLVVADATLRSAQITASFESADAQGFANSLAAAGGLRVVRQDDGSWLLERR